MATTTDETETEQRIVTIEREVTADLIEAFAEVSGDENPLHLDEEYASEETRFDGRIAHGMLVASFISAALAELEGTVIYMNQDLNFTAPVEIGDTLTVEVVPNGGPDGMTEASTNVVNQDDETVINGSAKVFIE